MVDVHVSDSAPSTNALPPKQGREVLRHLVLQLGSRVRREQLETWFRSLDVVRCDDQEIELSVTSQFVRDWLTRNFMPVLTEVVAGLGEPRRRIVLTHRDEDGWDSLRFAQPASLSDEIDQLVQSRDERQPRAATMAAGMDGSDAPAPAPQLHSQHLHSQMGQPQGQHASASSHVPSGRATGGSQGGANGASGSGARKGSQLNPNYTFDKFVVGPCNRLAHASALAIGENPGCAYNPLFVHGNVGLGKSHLLQAICHTVQRRDANARVVYMSCEDFTNAFITAIQTHQLDAFRAHYRSADILVIDDVQFLASKEKTQDEFFHTFNALYDGQKQIVLSSDRPPVEIPTVEERLVSRFKWGLVAEVEAPCFDTRVAIVRRKAAGRGIDLPEDVARFLAERVVGNIRELEGAVIKVVGVAAITEQPLSLALAESCIRGIPVRQTQVSAEDIMALITTEFAITSRELIGKSRTQTVSMPRQIAMWLLREHTESSLEDVGRIFGNRDHTTVLYAVNKIKERAQKDRLFKELLDGLGNRLMARGVRG